MQGVHFRVSGGTNFEKFSARCQPQWRLRGFDVCTGLPKKTLDTSLLKGYRFYKTEKEQDEILLNVHSPLERC